MKKQIAHGIAEGMLDVWIDSSEEKKTDTLTVEIITEFAERVIQSLENQPNVVSLPTVEQLVKHARQRFNVRQEEAAKLANDEHESWLPGNRKELFPEGGYWHNYQGVVSKRLPSKAANRLDTDTDKILDSLENPAKEGQWDRRGLVIGQVQSGKTNNYLGLIAKAADSGYRLIIVLAGVHNSLRSQTQQRVDEAILGRDTGNGPNSTGEPIGVGQKPGHRFPQTLTSADEHGDFKKAIADQAKNPFKELNIPTVFVIKKHVSILENLHEWLSDNSNKPAGHERISNMPVLVIDDEADNASIDTSNPKKDEDPTRTNKAIRNILDLFDQSAYVGYTATPFANVFIDPKEDESFGQDLFPRDFIFALRPPSNYVGPSRVFGLPDLSDESVQRDPLPILNKVNDASTWLPPDHKSDFEPDASLFPKSLRRAVLSFVLSNAARKFRKGRAEHNSMLIHVTRFTKPQAEITDQVDDLVSGLRNEVRYNAKSPLWDELESIWLEDFVSAARAMSDEEIAPPLHRFSEIRGEIEEALDLVTVRAINGTSKESLNYTTSEAVSIIAVGGDKLSRGLTLEGLTVSYYLRTTSLYDTLMQMGRWFGYRDGYLDLCRIYTSRSVIGWYRNIAMATDELLEEVKLMAAQNMTPNDFGLRVRHSPGMMVTSAIKMRNSKKRTVTFSRSRPEVTSLSIEPERRSKGLQHLEDLVSNLGSPDVADLSPYAWRGVAPAHIVQYFRAVDRDNIYPTATSSHPRYLADYIEKANTIGSLTSWTVLLKSKKEATPYKVNGQLPVGLSTRTHRGPLDRYAFKSLIGSADEKFDLTESELQDAKNRSGQQDPTGPWLREARPPNRGLLILYLLDPEGIMLWRPEAEGTRKPASHIPDGGPFAAFCVSFPFDPKQPKVEYRVNTIYEATEASVGGDDE